MTSPTVALPLVDGISNRLCFLITKYFTEVNEWTKQVFADAQYAYKKDDLASKQRPSIWCYPKNDKKNSFGYSEDGMIVLEIHFSFLEQRTYLAENMIQIANLIKLIFLNTQPYRYAQPFMPGLFWVGKEWHTDYSRAYKKESIIIMELDYRIDFVAYQQGLWRRGCDITSPDEQIYLTVEGLLEQIALLDQDLNPVIIT